MDIYCYPSALCQWPWDPLAGSEALPLARMVLLGGALFPDVGKTLKAGIALCKGQWGLCNTTGLWDLPFHPCVWQKPHFNSSGTYCQRCQPLNHWLEVVGAADLNMVMVQAWTRLSALLMLLASYLLHRLLFKITDRDFRPKELYFFYLNVKTCNTSLNDS